MGLIGFCPLKFLPRNHTELLLGTAYVGHMPIPNFKKVEKWRGNVSHELP